MLMPMSIVATATQPAASDITSGWTIALTVATVILAVFAALAYFGNGQQIKKLRGTLTKTTEKIEQDLGGIRDSLRSMDSAVEHSRQKDRAIISVSAKLVPEETLGQEAQYRCKWTVRNTGHRVARIESAGIVFPNDKTIHGFRDDFVLDEGEVKRFQPTIAQGVLRKGGTPGVVFVVDTAGNRTEARFDNPLCRAGT